MPSLARSVRSRQRGALVLSTWLAAASFGASCAAGSGPASTAPAPPRAAPAALPHAEPASEPSARIDREALVRRHHPSQTAIDPASPFMVGNGSLAMAADISGLGGFQDQYSPLVPLMIQAQWAWHEFPNPRGYSLEQSLVPVDVRGKIQHYPWLRDWAEAKRPEIAWLRENPHRFSLGRLSFYIEGAGGAPVSFAELEQTRQSLELWSGRLLSSFVLAPQVGGEPVEVETSVHPELDMLIVRVRSALLAQGRLGIELRFPGVAPAL